MMAAETAQCVHRQHTGDKSKDRKHEAARGDRFTVHARPLTMHAGSIRTVLSLPWRGEHAAPPVTTRRPSLRLPVSPGEPPRCMGRCR